MGIDVRIKVVDLSSEAVYQWVNEHDAQHEYRIPDKAIEALVDKVQEALHEFREWLDRRK